MTNGLGSVLGGAIAGLVVACTSASSSPATDVDASAGCPPGKVVGCTCPDLSIGRRVCGGDGAYELCLCSDAAAEDDASASADATDATAVPGTSVPDSCNPAPNASCLQACEDIETCCEGVCTYPDGGASCTASCSNEYNCGNDSCAGHCGACAYEEAQCDANCDAACNQSYIVCEAACPPGC